MLRARRILLALSCMVIFSEIALAVYFHVEIFAWLSHNLWVVFVPFLKVLFKRLVAFKLVVFLKSFVILGWHLSKLLMLKLLKTLSVRYGIFFSQNRWYWIRRGKVMFLRRGKQFFRTLVKFWAGYGAVQKWIILVAFFPVFLLLFLLGLSFNVTRKTMVQKAQESAIFEVAASASTANRGLRAWVKRLDKITLQKIRDLTPRGKNKQ